LSPLRVLALRLVGARIGARALISAGVKVWYPWNLTMGSRSTLGPEVEAYNFAPIILGDDTTVSQYTFLCTGTHDYTEPAMKLKFSPITIGSKAWVAAGSFIGPGVVIGEGAVVGARSVVTRNVRAWMVVAGNPAREVKSRTYSGR
jgi:putative colanic acid biosynthesis acetyltransferase WcaF